MRRLIAHEGIAEDRGKVALQRGPIVYCVEDLDVPGATPRGGAIAAGGVAIPPGAALTPEFKRDIVNGVEVIRVRTITNLASNPGRDRVTATSPRTFVAIPDVAWGNRNKSGMAVWVATRR